MGVPAFFAWLVKRFPSIVSYMPTAKPRVVNGQQIPPDATDPNPCGFEFDNLYLDMNGIIHPCCHPEDRDPPNTEEEMFQAIFDYIDHVFTLVRPRRLLYMAIDGVAPRAKMNQQRSRRFRAAQESKEAREARERRVDYLRSQGIEPANYEARKAKRMPFDSNCITPGTAFMDRLARALRSYVAERVASHPAWKDIKVVFSDASVPGEGEHKLLEFIRQQRTQEGYDPNMRHVLYGADADLIMLGLGTHEPQMYILREEHRPAAKKPCSICFYRGHKAPQCPGVPPINADDLYGYNLEGRTDYPPFLVVDLAELRRQLKQELRVSGGGKGTFKNIEKLIDDWIFLCCFVGNDFLPHLPSLSIHEGAIDTLVSIYRKTLHQMGGYINENGFINVKRAEMLMKELGKLEDEVFRKRFQVLSDKRAAKRQKALKKKHRLAEMSGTQIFDATQQSQDAAFEETAAEIAAAKAKTKHDAPSQGHNQSVASEASPNFSGPGRSVEIQVTTSATRAAVSSTGQPKSAFAMRLALQAAAAATTTAANASARVDGATETSPSILSKDIGQRKRGAEGMAKPSAKRTKVNDHRRAEVESEPDDSDGTDEGEDDLVLPVEASFMETEDDKPSDESGQRKGNSSKGAEAYEEGFKERYYMSKFKEPVTNVEFRRRVVTSYLQGLAWVMQYYYQGCPSWTWFYDYHYAPFASDFELIEKVDVKFREDSKPFLPLEQLMAVLPPGSADLVPPCWQGLMLKADSPLIKFYPEDFEVDLNGKKHAWQGVALLPFVDESLLLRELKRYERFNNDERSRNRMGQDVIVLRNAQVDFDGPTNLACFDEAKKLFGSIQNAEVSECIVGTYTVPDHLTKPYVARRLRGCESPPRFSATATSYRLRGGKFRPPSKQRSKKSGDFRAKRNHAKSHAGRSHKGNK